MHVSQRWQVGALAALCAFLGTAAWAQDHTGMISGSVADEQGQAVPGASVSLISEGTGHTRALVSDPRGDFRFVGVQPGTYTVRVELPSFRTLELKNKVLPTSSSLNLGSLKLAVGGLSDVVTVVADGTAIETENSNPSSLLTATQIEQISTIGRDVTSLLRLLPGVAYQDDADSLGGEGFASTLPNIGGARRHFNHITVDGVFANEIGGANNFSMLVNLDSIAEVKVLSSTYRAEIGRGTGQIQVTGKQGGSEYHGRLGYYKRHEMFNANDFFRNERELPKARYRFNTYNLQLGGPVGLPGVLDTKNLFFHYGGERALTTNPRAVREFRVPTLKERNGDFSETRRAPTRNAAGDCVPGSLIVITDPQTRQPFPGNVIPSGRINRSGQAILNLFPTPNVTDPCLPENYRMTPSTDIPKWNHNLRFDYRPSAADMFYLILRNNASEQIGFQTSAGPSARGLWGLYESHYDGGSNSATFGHSHTFHRGLLNEALVSYRRDTERTFTPDADLSRMQRANAGFTVGALHPEINPLDLIPNFGFGSANIPVRNNDNIGEINISNRFPLNGKNFAINLRDNLTWVKGSHVLKGGFYFEYLDDNEGAGANQGTFSFENNAANPYVTGFGFANALVGGFHSYTESSTRRSNDGHGSVLEWYVQDTWKASSKLTLDYGVRFMWISQPWRKSSDEYAVFVPSRWDPARAPLLYQPVRQGNTIVAGVDPRNGQRVSARFVGTYVPGTGDPSNGMVKMGDPSYPAGFRDKEPPLPEPRLGFAYDPLGRGQTVIRGGIGLTHQPQLGVGIVTDLGGNPPFGRTETTDFGTFDTLVSAERFLAPVDVRGFDPSMKTPSVYTFSLGMEQNIGFKTVVGATYVGRLGRHLNQNTNLNAIPPGARFEPENRDNGGFALADNFLRPYLGYAAVNYRSNFGTSTYHALEVSVVRRHTKGLQFSVAYTWSRALGISDEDGENIIQYRPLREWHYAPHVRSQTHNFQVSYTWDVPKASRLADNGVVRFLFDNWQISGENSLVSGNWKDVTLDRNNVDFTGGSFDLRPIMTGNPNGQRGDGLTTPWFDTSVFKRPEVAASPTGITSANFGTTPRRAVRLPGVNNWNLSFFKNFRLGEGHKLQFRWEMYNVLNHTQFSDLNAQARFDAAGNQINPEFGFMTNARDPRRMQASLSFQF